MVHVILKNGLISKYFIEHSFFADKSMLKIWLEGQTGQFPYHESSEVDFKGDFPALVLCDTPFFPPPLFFSQPASTPQVIGYILSCTLSPTKVAIQRPNHIKISKSL